MYFFFLNPCTVETFLIRIWIRTENFRIQDPDPYTVIIDNLYGSASLVLGHGMQTLPRKK